MKNKYLSQLRRVTEFWTASGTQNILLAKKIRKIFRDTPKSDFKKFPKKLNYYGKIDLLGGIENAIMILKALE